MFKNGDRVWVVDVEFEEFSNDIDNDIPPNASYHIIPGRVCDNFDRRSIKVKHIVIPHNSSSYVCGKSYAGLYLETFDWYPVYQVFNRMPTFDDAKAVVEKSLSDYVDSYVDLISFLFKSIEATKELKRKIHMMSIVKEGKWLR